MPAPDEGREIVVARDTASGLDLEVVSADAVLDTQFNVGSSIVQRLIATHRERLEEVSERHLPSGEKPDTIDLSTPPSKGDLMPRDWTPDPATDKQISYLNSLLAESVKMQLALKEKGVSHSDELMTKTREVVEAAERRVKEGSFTKGNASQAIDFVVAMNRSLKERLRTFRDGSHSVYGRETRVRVTEDGMYQKPGVSSPYRGDVYKVQFAKNGSGRLYAKRLEIVTPAELNRDGTVRVPARGKFVYAPGALRELTPDMKMPLSEAKKFGALYGICCACARDLTAEQSIEEGIGPVCGKRFSDDPPLFDMDSPAKSEVETA